MTGTRALVAFTDPTTGSAAVLPFVLDSSAKLQLAPLTSRPLDIPSSPPPPSSAEPPWRSTRPCGWRPTERRSTMCGTGAHRWRATPPGHPTAEPICSVPTPSSAHSRGGSFCPSVVVARYLRQYESAGPSWYYAHAAVQLVGFVMGTAGFAVGLHLGRSSSRSAVYGLHGKLGAAAFSTAALQTLALLFRPKTTHRFRRYWKSYHHLVGYTCVVLAIVNVFQGFELMGLGRSYAKLGYCLVLSTLLGVCVTLEVNAWFLSQRRTHEGEKKTRTERGIVESSSEG
ncbi:unnamed protein product [Spirodela intermedia]|uniref:Cytochrome b561 domain-containing protein n=1 Tax=Spirodela intermedia TaxID=51605 RepID=A0A7I8IMK1_SPIIN|nr:unnamed protein product [Spirodela intermedia]CAA6659177.1 unnamed protein product [Spirodela intermedia]